MALKAQFDEVYAAYAEEKMLTLMPRQKSKVSLTPSFKVKTGTVT